MTSTAYLFDNAVLDRNARLANGLPVESELVFAERILFLAAFPPGTIEHDDALLDTFLDRKKAIARTQVGGIRLHVLIPVFGLAASAWGWFHSSSSPNGATVLAVLVIAATVGIVWGFGRRWRRAEREAAAYTKDVADRLVQDTSGDHLWDA